MIQKLLIQKSGESPAQIAVNDIISQRGSCPTINPQKLHKKNRYDEECLIQKLLIQKSGESPAQIAVNDIISQRGSCPTIGYSL